jgi:hypothetical protein
MKFLEFVGDHPIVTAILAIVLLDGLADIVASLMGHPIISLSGCR